jgi:hypothetical protein
MITDTASPTAEDSVECQVRAALLMACGPRARFTVSAVPAMGPARAAVSLSDPHAHRPLLQLPRRWRRAGMPQLKGARPELGRCARRLLAAGYRVEYVYAAGDGYLAVWPGAAACPAGSPRSELPRSSQPLRRNRSARGRQVSTWARHSSNRGCCGS